MKQGRVTLGPALTGVKRAEISAVITRADGTIEDLGVIAEQDFTPPWWKRMLLRIKP